MRKVSHTYHTWESQDPKKALQQVTALLEDFFDSMPERCAIETISVLTLRDGVKSPGAIHQVQFFITVQIPTEEA